MAFDWTWNIGHVVIIVTSVGSVVVGVVKIQNYIGEIRTGLMKLETIVAPIAKAFEGNGQPGILTRLVQLEGDVEANQRAVDHAFRNFEQVCVLRHEKLDRKPHA